MRDLENNMDEFKMCGDIRVAARTNTLVMTCSFCHQMFKHSQVFMRHLHLEHNDKLEFMEEDKEVEVYTVEELINKSALSCAVDGLECDEDNGKWFSEGKYGLPKSKVEGDDKEVGNVVNTSILLALQDCDVSFSTLDGLCCESKQRADQKESDHNKLLRQIQNDWEDSDTNESIENNIGCSETEMVNFKKKYPSINTELQKHVTMQEITRDESSCSPQNESVTKENINNWPSKCIKDVLQDLLNTDDVGTSLGTRKLTNEDENKKINAQNNICFKDTLVNYFNRSQKTYSNKSKILSNGQFTEMMFHRKTSEILVDGKQLFQGIGLHIQSKKLDDFEEQLQDLEDILDKDIIKSKNPIKYKQSNCEEKFNLYGGNDIYNINNNNTSYLDKGKQLENIQKSCKKSENKAANTEGILNEKISNASVETVLNEDLTKALTDAIDNEVDLLNIQLEDDSDEPLNEDILNLLERELMDKNDEESLKPHNEKLMAENIHLKDKVIKNLGKKTAYANKKENAATKYRKTNLKAKTIMETTLNKGFLKLPGLNKHENLKKSKELFKRNNHVIKNLQQYQKASIKSTLKTKFLTNANEEISNKYRQKNNSVIENLKTREAVLSIQRIEEEKLTPTLNFINMERGDKTTMKQEQIFFKPSTKIPRRQENLTKTVASNKMFLKKSPRKQTKQENIKVLIPKRQQRNSKSPLKIASRSNTINIETIPLRNISIKLQRFTPDKLADILRDEEKRQLQENEQQLVKNFQLPKKLCLSMGSASRSSSKKRQKLCKMEDTPNKQLSSKSCLQNGELDKRNKQKLSEMQKNIQKEAHVWTKRLRRASMDILTPPKSNVKTQVPTAANKNPSSCNLECKSYAINRSSRKKEVIQRMQNIKKEILKSIKESECEAMKSQLKQELYIENVQILPNLFKDKRLFAQLNNSLDNNTAAASPISANQNKNVKSIAKTLKRKSLLNKNAQIKGQQKSLRKGRNEVHDKILNLQDTQIDLSESVVDCLQQDLKTNRTNVESLLHEDVAKVKETYTESSAVEVEYQDASFIVNDLLEQLDKEQQNTEDFNNSDAIEDFDEAKDINLLTKFGLKIIKTPEIEDDLCLEQREKMYEKAYKFAKIYQKWPRIYMKKFHDNSITKKEFKIIFKQMLAEIKTSVNINLSLKELKRLINLINIWYGQCMNNKLIEKQRTSDAINNYMNLFYFIPKISKCFYHCEHCEEYFSTKHKYCTHRIVHTGSRYPYVCEKCFKGFKIAKFLRNHESSCNLILNNNMKSNYNYIKSTSHNKYKCLVCGQIFINSKLLYEHSATHLKTIYNCAKCPLVFASNLDVRNHMAQCNNAIKRMPNQFKPRREKDKELI